MKHSIRNFAKRILACVLGIVLAPPSGFALYYRCTHLDAARKQEWVLRVFFWAIFEIIVMVFIGSLLSIIWALFTPAWVERFFRSDLILFVCTMSSIVIIVAGIIACIRYLAS